MLDTDTKRRIDTARDILVGKVPDPKSQVEQITIALIYKFMDDMDAEAEEFGGKRKFFAKEFARYGWAKLMRSGLGGHEILNLYAEAITKMPENPGIPLLFRDIFKNAYLPYRDPETLKMFLKVIDEFTYDHSERLGDAFEYLLSVLGSQGDAGQFRTPRHIIDFIVEVIDPKKTETVLDPACGTAGFLISSYKHILAANRIDIDKQDGKDRKKKSCESCPSMFVSSLTPDEKGRLAQNFKGYDISPDMVRLSLVNMYLHGFADPHIAEYDTLTSQDKWNEYADVILANPPFMSPKGGIKPHNRFGVKSKRSEVLFVDYMAEHLTPSGRAGIIVPEGIIFQSQTAYKQLRKMLVEEYLVAVVSLPAGVFNPYSGVKTSILILDKSLAKRSGTIAFFKVENDGFGLGAQRREIDKNDLPRVAAAVKEFTHMDRQDRQDKRRKSHESSPSMLNALVQRGLAIIVEKEKIAANGDYNLSGERYRVNRGALTVFPFRSIKEIAAEVQAGFASGQSSVDTVGVPHLRPMNVNEEGKFVPEGTKYISEDEYKGREGYALEPGDVLFNNTNSKELIGKTCLIEIPIRGGFSNHMTRIRVNRDLCVPRFLALLLHSAWRKGQFSERATRWVGQAGINVKFLSEFQIPLPPLEVQKEIVAEIEGYQKVIDGARAVLDHYRPHIPIHPDWPTTTIGETCTLSSGGTPSKANDAYWIGDIPWVSGKDMKTDRIGDAALHISKIALEESATQIAPVGSLLILVRGMGLANGIPIAEVTSPCAFNQDIRAIHPPQGVNPSFLLFILRSHLSQFEQVLNTAAHGTLKIDTDDLRDIRFPLPPLATQQAIVAEIEAEQALVAANRELIVRLEKKIQATLARVWGEDKPTPAEA